MYNAIHFNGLGRVLNMRYTSNPPSPFRNNGVMMIQPLARTNKRHASIFASLAKPKHHPYLVRNSTAAGFDISTTASGEPSSIPSSPSTGRRNRSTSFQQRGPKGPRPVVRFTVPEFVTAPGQVLALVGSGPALGNWDAAQAVRLSWREGHRWVANVQLEAGWHGALEFKLALIDGSCAVWEPGSNRLVVVDEDVSSDGGPMEVTCCWGTCAGRPPVPAMVHVQQGDDMAECTVVIPEASISPADRGNRRLGDSGTRMVLSGGAPQLGDWAPDRGLALERRLARDLPGFSILGDTVGDTVGGGEADQFVWTATVRLPLDKLVEAKIAVAPAGHPFAWEQGPNRSILLSPPAGAFIRQPDNLEGSCGASECSQLPLEGESSGPTEGVKDSPASVSGRSSWEGQNDGSNSADSLSRASPMTTAVSQAAMLGMEASSSATGWSAGHVRGRRGRVSGGRGYLTQEGRGNDAELAELLGVVDSDEDSEFDDDGRPRASTYPQLSSPTHIGPSGTELLNNILSYDGLPALASGREAQGQRRDGSPSGGGIVSSSYMHGGDSKPGSSNSSMDIDSMNPHRGSAAGSLAAAAAAAASASNTASTTASPTVSSSPQSETSVGGDFILLVHWGVPLCSQAVYRPLMQLPSFTGTSSAPPVMSPSSSPTAATVLHVTVPQLETLPGQSVVVCGSSPLLGGWDPSRGIQLKWGPGNRWTGQVEVALSEATEMKVVVCGPGNSAAFWEPGVNRHVDLPALVAANSPSGAADVHLTCSWGAGQTTAALCIPKEVPLLEISAKSSLQEGQEAIPSTTSTSLGIASETLGDHRGGALSPTRKQADHVEELSRLLGMLLLSSTAPEVLPGIDFEAQAQRQQMEEEQSILLERLQESVASKQREVEELIDRLSESASSRTTLEGRLCLLEAASLAAQEEVAAVRTAAAEAVSAAQADVADFQLRLTAEVGASRAEYEQRIIDVQRQYEARILDLQQHETRILHLQQQHTRELDGLKSLHAREAEKSREALKAQEHHSKDLQQRMYTQARRHEAALKDRDAKHQSQLDAVRRQAADAAEAADERRRLDTLALVARMQEVEAKADEAIRSLVAEHAEVLRKKAASHDEKLAEVVLRLITSEREAETAATSARQQYTRRVSDLESARAALEQRGLALAQNVGAKQLEVDSLRAQLAKSEASRLAVALERDQLRSKLQKAEMESKREEEQKQQPRGGPSSDEDRSVGYGRVSPSDGSPQAVPVWAMRPIAPWRWRGPGIGQDDPAI